MIKILDLLLPGFTRSTWRKGHSVAEQIESTTAAKLAQLEVSTNIREFLIYN
jgi:hypothetical protein